jgi:dihydrofolate synthase / folylpolyglutamate synthase
MAADESASMSTRAPGSTDRTAAFSRAGSAAHNEAGAATLAEYLREAVPGGRQPLVFGAMRDKDHAGMLRHLLPHASRVVLTVPPSPRAADPALLKAAVLSIDPGARVDIEADSSAAMDAA